MAGGKYCKWDCPHMCQMCMDAELSALNQAEQNGSLGWYGWESDASNEAGYSIYPIKKFTDPTTPAPVFVPPAYYKLKLTEIVLTEPLTIEGHTRLTAGRVLE